MFGFDTYLSHNAIRFTNAGEDYVFELPRDLALDVADAYRAPGRVLDFTHVLAVYGIGAPEDVLLVCARRRKLALLVEE